MVSLFAGVLFSRASEAHFVELDQQLLDSKLTACGERCMTFSRGTVKSNWPMN